MLYTISAHGEIEPEDVDVLHTSAAAHMASIKRRKKKARSGGSKSKNNSLRVEEFTRKPLREKIARCLLSNSKNLCAVKMLAATTHHFTI